MEHYRALQPPTNKNELANVDHKINRQIVNGWMSTLAVQAMTEKNMQGILKALDALVNADIPAEKSGQRAKNMNVVEKWWKFMKESVSPEVVQQFNQINISVRSEAEIEADLGIIDSE